jgi:hypothetical protein
VYQIVGSLKDQKLVSHCHLLSSNGCVATEEFVGREFVMIGSDILCSSAKVA